MKRRLGTRPRRGPLSPNERARRTSEAKLRDQMGEWLFNAFGELRMMENASLIVWTKGQMRGVRATIKRLGIGKEPC